MNLNCIYGQIQDNQSMKIIKLNQSFAKDYMIVIHENNVNKEMFVKPLSRRMNVGVYTKC